MAVSKKRKTWFVLLVALYLGAGINHFLNPDFYLGVMPLWLPFKRLLVDVSGVAEILLAVLLLFPSTQKASAWLICAMLVVFLFVIHIPMVLDFHGWNDIVWWIAVIRLPVQYFLVKWAWAYTRGTTVMLPERK